MKPSIYLAGPITGLTYAAAESWRIVVKTELSQSVLCYSPLRAQDYLIKHGVLGSDPYDENCMTTEDGIMTRDYWDVQRTDLTFVNLLGAKRVSIGTVLEIGFAYAHRKPVVLVMEKEGNPHEHAMIRKAGVFRTDNLYDGIGLTKAILLPG